MRDNNVTAGSVIAVLLADGWHRIVRGSFSVGPLALGLDADLGTPGFWFEEADVGSPSRPTALTGPLDNIIAVRQAAPAVRSVGDPDRSRTVHNGQRVDPVTPLRIRAGC